MNDKREPSCFDTPGETPPGPYLVEDVEEMLGMGTTRTTEYSQREPEVRVTRLVTQMGGLIPKQSSSTEMVRTGLFSVRPATSTRTTLVEQEPIIETFRDVIPERPQDVYASSQKQGKGTGGARAAWALKAELSRLAYELSEKLELGTRAEEGKALRLCRRLSHMSPAWILEFCRQHTEDTGTDAGVEEMLAIARHHLRDNAAEIRRQLTSGRPDSREADLYFRCALAEWPRNAHSPSPLEIAASLEVPWERREKEADSIAAVMDDVVFTVHPVPAIFRRATHRG